MKQFFGKFIVNLLHGNATDTLLNDVIKVEQYMKAIKYLDQELINNLLVEELGATAADNCMDKFDQIKEHIIDSSIDLEFYFLQFIYEKSDLPLSLFIKELELVPTSCVLDLVEVLINLLSSMSTLDIEQLQSVPSHINLSIISLLHNKRLIDESYSESKINKDLLFDRLWIEQGLPLDKLLFVITNSTKSVSDLLLAILKFQMPYFFTFDLLEYHTNQPLVQNCDIITAFQLSNFYSTYTSVHTICNTTDTSLKSGLILSNAFYHQNSSNFHFKMLKVFYSTILTDSDHFTTPLHYSCFKIDSYSIEDVYLLLMALKRAVYMFDQLLIVNTCLFKGQKEQKIKEKFYVDYLYILETATYQSIMQKTTHLSKLEISLISKWICDDFESKNRHLLNALAFQTFPLAYIAPIAHFANKSQLNEVAKDLLNQPVLENRIFAFKLLGYCKNAQFKLHLEAIITSEKLLQNVNLLSSLNGIAYFSGLTRLLLDCSFKCHELQIENPLKLAFHNAFKLFNDL